MNHVISLGSLCHTAMMIKRNGWKKCSFPLDWVFSSISTTVSCVRDNFTAYLDKSKYTEIPGRDDQCGHKDFVSNFFNHRNPLRNAEDYAYTRRCVERYRTVMKNSDKKLFVFASYNQANEPISASERKAVLELNGELYGRTRNASLVYIKHCVSEKEERVTVSREGNITFIHFLVPSRSGGVVFQNSKYDALLDKTMKEHFAFAVKDW